MNRYLLLLALLTVSLPLASGEGIQDTFPDSGLWTSTSDVAAEAICYTKLSQVNVKDSEFGAIIRVYLINNGKHPVMHVGSVVDSGFTLQGKDANGNSIGFRKPEQEISSMRVNLPPGVVKSFTITIYKRDMWILNKEPLFINGLIFDPSTRQGKRIEVPLHFK